MLMHQIIRRSFKKDLLASIFLLLAGIAHILFVRYVAPKLDTYNSEALILPFFLAIFGLLFIFSGFLILIEIFPHYKQLGALLKMNLFEEMILNIETEALEGQTYYLGKLSFSGNQNQDQDMVVNLVSSELQKLASNIKVKVYVDKSRTGQRPIIIETGNKFFVASVSSWPSINYSL